MRIRAFRTTFLCAIDEEELDGTPSLEEVKEYLADVLRLQLDDEYGTKPVGLSSVEVNIEGLEELSSEDVKKLYGNAGN